MEAPQEMETGDWAVVGIYFVIVFAVGMWVRQMIWLCAKL